MSITKGILYLIQVILAFVTFISKFRFIIQISFLNLRAIIKVIVQFKSWIPKTFESYFKMVSPSILNSDHVNKSLVLFFLAIYNFG